MNKKRAAAPLLIALSLSTSALAQTVGNSAPQAVSIVQTVPDARDVAYPGGVMTLDIDASDTIRATWKVTQTIPVVPGTIRLTLLFPQWLPGNHGPRGAMSELVDLHFFADGKELTWKRDQVEVFSFHIDVPAGAKAVVAKFVNTTPLQSSEGRITVTREMLNLQWENVSLYPAGHYVRQIRVKPTVIFPAGWQVASALDGKTVGADNAVTWAETDYETLVDSPLFAGAYFRKWDLGQNVTLNVVADKPEQLAAKDEHIELYRALVTEARLAFGANHFDHYDFLLALTDRMGGIGLEHHRSSENQLEPDSFTEWDKNEWDRGLLPHEYSHSWSGKFRRPARLWTPDYRQPMQGDLLWAYEGQDQFWGWVLGVRSGLVGKEMALGDLASDAGQFTQWPGRGWRSVEDTGFDPVFAARKPKPNASISRNEDYYTEGLLIWLEADQIIRAGAKGANSIDSFAQSFFGMREGDWGQLPFEADEIVTRLTAIYPYDWKTFIDRKLNQPGQPAPVAGIELGGYRLVWKDEPNPYDKARFGYTKGLSLFHSLGMAIDKDGKITGTRWDGPAFNAGLVTGVKIIAVSGETYDQDGIKKAITAAKTGGTAADKPIELTVQRGTKVMQVQVNYHDGLRWPWLERAAPGKAPTGLDLLLTPRRPMPKPAPKVAPKPATKSATGSK